MKPPHIARHLALAALATLAGCQTLEVKKPTVEQTAEIRKGPEDRPQRSITGFSHALRCMDTLMLDYGVRDITMLTEEITDETKKLNAGTRDMLISSVSDMSRRSRAVRLVAFGKGAEVAIDGNGEVQLAANNPLAVLIAGAGHVRYHGNPAVTRSIQGIGSIEKY